MVAPVTGPTTIVRTNNLDGQGSYYDLRKRFGQAKPYDLVLPYVRERYVTVSSLISPDWYSGGMANAGATSANKVGPYFFDNLDTDFGPLAQARNLAVEKYRSKRSESADLLTNLIQRKRAMSMISTRGLQLLALAAAIASKDYRRVSRAMSRLRAAVPRRNTWRSVSKNFASAWLEFSYGWVPAVKDIGSAVSLLQEPLPQSSTRVRGKSVPFEKTYTVYQDAYEYHGGSYSGSVNVQIGSVITITNPNLYLASQLGFTNPAATLWEAIPFSFVVDWFVPVQGFLQNFNSSHGISEDRAYHTIVWKATSTTRDWVRPPYSPVTRIVTTQGMKMQRVTGIPGITPILRPPWQLSPWRAANAISLLVGFLSKRA